MEIRYYTIHEDGHYMVWDAGMPPALQFNPIDYTGDTDGLRSLFSTRRMVFVPWEVVQILSN